MIEVLFVCVTIIIVTCLVLGFFMWYGMKRDAFEKKVMEAVESRLIKSTDYRKDLEVVNSNQLKLANEIESVRKMIQMKSSNTFAGRPPGSIV